MSPTADSSALASGGVVADAAQSAGKPVEGRLTDGTFIEGEPTKAKSDQDASTEDKPSEDSPAEDSAGLAFLKPRRRGAHRALVVLCALAVIAAIEVASPVLLPVLVGGFVALLLNPAVVWLSQGWLPRSVSALLVMSLVFGGLVFVANAVYEPAVQAAAEAPQMVQRLQQRLERMTRPLANAGKVGEALEAIERIGSEPTPSSVSVRSEPIGLSQRVGGVLAVAASAGTAAILTYLFLVFGELLFRRIVTIAPTRSNKRSTVEIVRSIQSEVSRYVVTVTVINMALGAATALALWVLGVADPLLWGLMATLLNFAPYIGPLVGVLVLLTVGILQFDAPGTAVLPAACYLGLNVLESQLLTPLVLGRSFSLNPVVILIWLAFWGWLWGTLGLLLAMPMLVCAKIVCARSEALRPWAMIIER
jgi:predicted PurR-regulated permease PerM